MFLGAKQAKGVLRVGRNRLLVVPNSAILKGDDGFLETERRPCGRLNSARFRINFSRVLLMCISLPHAAVQTGLSKVGLGLST